MCLSFEIGPLASGYVDLWSVLVTFNVILFISVVVVKIDLVNFVDAEGRDLLQALVELAVEIVSLTHLHARSINSRRALSVVLRHADHPVKPVSRTLLERLEEARRLLGLIDLYSDRLGVVGDTQALLASRRGVAPGHLL